MLIVKNPVIVKFFIVFVYSMFMSDISFAQVSYSDEREAESDAAREMKSDKTQAAVEMGGGVEGIVIGVNPSSRSISVQDVDEDDTIYNISVKDSTTYAGADSISDINVGDTISVDIYSLDGEHIIAETIAIEKRAYKEEPPPPTGKVLSD